MLFRLLAALLCISGSAFAQNPQTTPKPNDKPPVKVEQPAKVEAAKPNVVSGLSLPDNFEVEHDEGFITLEATCAGPVEWIVLTTAPKIKYRKVGDKDIDISVPPIECTITVFCYGVVDGKPTRAARCDISVKGPQAPIPPPKPPVDPKNTVKGPFVVSVIENPTKRDPTYTILTRWVDASNALIKAGHKPYLLSNADPKTKAWLNAAAAKDKEFADALKAAGVPFVVIQDFSGRALGVIPCPKTAVELLAILAKED